MRLIDADAFKEYLRKGAETNADIIPQRLVDAVLDIMDGIMLDIDEQPTVDAVPVVRCMDCKFSEVFQNDSSGVMARYCKAFTLERMVADDDYCSYGERIGDE